MKRILAICAVLILVLAASPLKACDRVQAFSAGVGHCAVQAFAAPVVQAQAVFAAPTYQTQQVVQVPVQAPVVYQQAFAVPIVQQFQQVQHVQAFRVQRVQAVRSQRVKTKQKIR